jgi:hypothetical protein
MNKEIPFDQDKKPLNLVDVSNSTLNILRMPLRMVWKPKEDITTYELAMCLPYLLRQTFVMPYEIDKTEPHMRHFEIHDPN